MVEDGEGAAGTLARFRRELYWCLWRCPRDALFELADADGPWAGFVATSPAPAGHRAHSYVMLSKCGNI